MGIRGLNTFIKKVCPECITTNLITKYEGKIFGIDASILLYKYRHISNIDNSCINSHIIGFINRILYYKRFNIIPVFIFDGIPPEQKKITLKKRQTIKRKIYEKIELLQQLTPKTEIEKFEIENEIAKLSMQIINVTKSHIDDVKRVLDLIGVNYYDAPDEAEKYCVFLQKSGIIDYIVSDDTDVFTFGGNNVLKSSIKNNIVEINIEQFLLKVNYDMKKFIDFCILSGCDYLPYVPSLAINTVNTLFKKYDTIEDIIELKKYTFTEEYNNLNEVREIFTKFNYKTPIELKNNIINKDEFKIFLEEKNIKNIDKIIEKF
jgi:flap endonuclease-1